MKNSEPTAAESAMRKPIINVIKSDGNRPDEQKTLSTVSPETPERLPKEDLKLVGLSKDLSELLLYSAKKLQYEEANAQNIASICKCSSELIKIMKLKLELERLKK